MRVIPYGPHALLAEYDSLEEVMAASTALTETRREDVVDLVPAARTILVIATGDTDGVEAWLRSTVPVLAPIASEQVTIDVRYDGEDLADVAARCELSVDEVVQLHSTATYTCAFCGFLPGFSYLVGLEARLHLPRRSTPRTKVPAGAIAIAAEFTAVYPSASPGGWHLLGTTDAVLWDESREVPALLPPGSTVRFRPV